LFFWDIAGQKEFEFMRPTFYKGSKAAIIVFSHTNEESFKRIPEWHNNIKDHVGDLPIVLFGNKIDLINEDEHDDEKIQELVKERSFLGYFKTSAKTGSGVYEAFRAIIMNLYNKYKET
jgi:small GTP-binding protein